MLSNIAVMRRVLLKCDCVVHKGKKLGRICRNGNVVSFVCQHYLFIYSKKLAYCLWYVTANIYEHYRGVLNGLLGVAHSCIFCVNVPVCRICSRLCIWILIFIYLCIYYSLKGINCDFSLGDLHNGTAIMCTKYSQQTSFLWHPHNVCSNISAQNEHLRMDKIFNLHQSMAE